MPSLSEHTHQDVLQGVRERQSQLREAQGLTVLLSDPQTHTSDRAFRQTPPATGRGVASRRVGLRVWRLQVRGRSARKVGFR